MKFKTTIPDAPPSANPEAGARQMSGKSNMPEGALIKGPNTGAFKDATEDKGVARKCIDVQVDGDDKTGHNGNPKKRNAASWGRTIADQA